MKKIRHLIWQLFGRPELPPRNFRLIAKINKYNNKQIYIPRYYEMANMYLNNYDLIDIAKEYNVTRERVRQCIWKAYRENEMNNGT